MLLYGKIFSEGTGLRKMRQRFLSEACAEGMCVAIHSNDKSLVLCHLSCIVLRVEASGLEPQAFLYSLDFLLLFDQAKSKYKYYIYIIILFIHLYHIFTNISDFSLISFLTIIPSACARMLRVHGKTGLQYGSNLRFF